MRIMAYLPCILLVSFWYASIKAGSMRIAVHAASINALRNCLCRLGGNAPVALHIAAAVCIRTKSYQIIECIKRMKTFDISNF